ncbi:hypothetical protein RJD11_06235 [Bacillus velezensis]|uniref:hypothetical protein n=1 Tax=Bacillus TaxID=1386 RepID=UPI001C52D65C|nr:MULTISPECIES: hypothetical protein [Bacillus amyloliquefaciens group]QXP98299.1 hypothetical protein KVY05_06180 [Bacillus velezensis]UHH04123.1 hypothetical protein LUA14_06225 [Bacillus amyloliquefaciens]ULR23852.1 hypothetical protein MJE83_06225 [Bacillus velezensis]UVW10657.1 hypothetical protein NX856_06235 [Bacillus velezensis]WHL77989.1 hypothetical protein QLH34_06225 [Bacillus velezensis]
MDKLQEIISDLSLWHLASKEELKPLDINAGSCYIIEQSYVKDIMIGYMRKQQAIIEEHQRQQDVTVIQFRQAQEEIKRLKYENDNFRRLLATFTDEEDDPFGVVRKALNGQFPAAWEGDAE